MKNLLVGIVVVVLGLLAYNYVTTGEVSLTAAFTLSAEEQQVRELERDLHSTIKSFNEAGRTAGLAGVDMTADADAARRTVLQIKKEVKALQKRLTEDGAKRRAAELAAEVDKFVAELR